MSARARWVVAVTAAALALAACGSSSDSAGGTTPAAAVTTASSEASSSPASSGPQSPPMSTAGSPGADTCTAAGGQVQPRTAAWGTNNDQSSWLALAGYTDVCRFEADDEAKSRIYVDLVTLSSTEPTLAGLAYLSKVPAAGTTDGSNPAPAYCAKLGGSSTFGSIGASGGGWVNTEDPVDVTVSLCVFPDLSFIDDWGLTYHSAGDIRGKDLATVMAYRPSGPLPPVFTTS